MKQNPDKTDFTNARLLADLERVGYLPGVWLAPEEVRELRRLVRYRQQPAGERKNLKLRVGALSRDGRVVQPDLHPCSVAWIQWLRQTPAVSAQTRWIVDRQLARLASLSLEITAVERHLRQLTAADKLVQALLTLKGIGLITAVTLRAEIDRFDRFRSGKQLARYCDLSPCNASSGQHQADAGLIKAGNPQLRIDTLFELIARELSSKSARIRYLIACCGILYGDSTAGNPSLALPGSSPARAPVPNPLRPSEISRLSTTG
jgi:transposase